MNIDPQAVRILCYGDSNTWGQIPGPEKKRYAVNERWTGVLQKKLGPEYEILEEGLSSRTVNLEDPSPDKPERNGLRSFYPCLETHFPFKMVILMLGTNDVKTQYQREPHQVAEGVRSLVHELEEFAQKKNVMRPELVLVSPPLVKEVREIYVDGANKSAQLANLYQQIAAETERCYFLDAAQVVESSEVDGVHWEKSGHKAFAELVFNLIK